MTGPRVSVVVPTKDSGLTLERCLESVTSQTCTDLEIIVVDDLSSDSTVEIARNYADKVISKRSSMPGARNLGLGLAKGDWILSLDSDMVLAPRVVEQCLDLTQQKCTAVLIPEVSVGESFWGDCIAFYRNLFLESQRQRMYGYPRFYSRNILEQIDGWDESLTWGEDADLLFRLRERISLGVCLDPVFHLEGKPTLWEIYQKWRSPRKGATYNAFRSKYPKEDRENFFRDHLQVYSRDRNWAKAVQHPVMFVGSVLVQVVKATAMATAVANPRKTA